MWAFLTALFRAITGISKVAEKAIPSEKIQEENHARKKHRKTSRELILIYDREFRRLKDHWEIDIATDINFVHNDMEDDQRTELIELLTDRIDVYRIKRPIRFRKWIQQQRLLNQNKQR